VYDLDTVALAQQTLAMRTARHDLAIDFHGDAAVGIAGAVEQMVDGRAYIDFVRFAVEEDVQHARIVVALVAQSEKTPGSAGRFGVDPSGTIAAALILIVRLATLLLVAVALFLLVRRLSLRLSALDLLLLHLLRLRRRVRIGFRRRLRLRLPVLRRLHLPAALLQFLLWLLLCAGRLLRAVVFAARTRIDLLALLLRLRLLLHGLLELRPPIDGAGPIVLGTRLRHMFDRRRAVLLGRRIDVLV
jgi:hypothetical protein